MVQRPIKVLLVEPDEARRGQTRETLREARGTPFRVEGEGTLAGALQRLSNGGVEVVLLTLDLPDSRGMSTFERMYAFAPDVPVVVLTDQADESAAAGTVKGGAQDYLVREELHAPLLARSLRHAIERHRLLSALRTLSLIDDLTGLYNQRGFLDLGAQYLKLARRTDRQATLVYLDVDRFKTINDTLGHHTGDRALKQVAEVLRSCFRRADILARLEGDAFGILALEDEDELAGDLLDRVRRGFREFNEANRSPYQLSVSLGMARQAGDQRVRLEDLLADADHAMHREKREKRPTVLQGQP